MPGRLTFVLDFTPPKEFEKRMKKFEPGGSFEHAAARAFVQTADAMRADILARVPQASGDLKDSIRVVPIEAGLRSSVHMVATAHYAAAVEEGSVPHVTTSPRVAEWAALKGIPARWVYKAIAKRGTRPQPFFEPASELGRRVLLDRLARLPGVV